MKNGYTIVSTAGFNLLSDEGRYVQYILIDKDGDMEGYYNSLEEIEEEHGPIKEAEA